MGLASNLAILARAITAGGLLTGAGIDPASKLPAGVITPFAARSVPTGWLKCDGSAVSRAAYPDLFAALVKTSAVTISIATPGVVTWTAHGLAAGDPVKFSTTGVLPTGLVAGTTYFVAGTITANTFQVAATAGGAAIATTGTQSGVHTAIHAPHGDGNGTTTFNLPDLRGEFLRGVDDGRGVDAARGIGSAQAEMIGPHTHTVTTAMPAIGTSGSINRAASNNPVGGAVATEANAGTENRPRNKAVLYIIKT